MKKNMILNLENIYLKLKALILKRKKKFLISLKKIEKNNRLTKEETKKLKQVILKLLFIDVAQKLIDY